MNVKLFMRLSILFAMWANSLSIYSYNNPFLIGGNYTGEVLSNMSGGIERGINYLGYLSVSAAFDTEKIGLRNGPLFQLGVANTHGGTPTKTLIGDIQTASNIEAGDHLFFEELTYSQRLGRLSFTIGLQDMNANYAITRYAENYINSSFGIFSTFAINYSSPIFPLTGLGIHLRYDFSEKFALQTALFDGKIDDFDTNRYNHRWNISTDEGYLWIAEAQIAPLKERELMGYYTIAAHYHSGGNTFGFYGTLSQDIWSNENRTLQLFCQLSYMEKKKNYNYFYLGTALNCVGVFSNSDRDVMGMGVAFAHTADFLNETTIEWFYKYNLNNVIYSQLDLQYIINPLGTAISLSNAAVMILRFCFEF